MRNLTLSLIALGACFLVFTNVQAQAEVTNDSGLICFPFENLDGNNNNTEAIGNYMTGIMGSEVTVENAKITDNFTIFGVALPWLGKPDGDYYMKTDGSKYLDIYFDTPISKVCGDGRVFLGLGSPDYRVIGLYDDMEIDRFEDDVCLLGNVPFKLCFDTPVNQLRIGSDSCIAVALDNLCVKPVPVPGAGLLGMLGIGVTSWLKRRRTL